MRNYIEGGLETQYCKLVKEQSQANHGNVGDRIVNGVGAVASVVVAKADFIY